MDRRKMVQKIKTPVKGQSLLEFALMLPILLLIVLGVIEFGRIFVLYTEASNAAREAARYGVAAGNSPNNVARYLDCDEIRQAALDTVVLSDFEPIEDNIEIAYDDGNNNGILDDDCDSGALSENDIFQGYRIVVTVTTSYEPILPIIPITNLNFSPSSRRTILKDIVIQNEPELPPPPPGCRRLDIAPNPPEGGDVSVNKEPNCGASWYIQGEVVTISAFPNSGYEFQNWGGSVSQYPGSSNPVMTITMNDNESALANFLPEECYQIDGQATPLNAGVVTFLTLPNCQNGGYTPDLGVQMQADPAVGFVFDSWVTNQPANYPTYEGNIDNPLVLQSGDLVSDVTFTAVFSQPVANCYDIAWATAPPDEGVVLFNPAAGEDCPGGWIPGDVTITAQVNDPNAYEFDSWSSTSAPIGDPSLSTTTITVDDNETLTLNLNQIADVADLFIQKSDSVDPATIGQQFTYSLLVGNNGPDAAGDVRVQDSLPASVTPISTNPSQGSCGIGGNVVNCTIGFMPAFTNQTVDIVVVPNQVGTIVNTASVFNNDTNQIDTNGSNNSDSETTQVRPSADLAVLKTGPATALQGDIITYNLVVSNTGPSNAVSVVLVDALPLATSYLNSTTSVGACGQSGTQVVCNFGNMPANGTPINVTINALATAPSNALNQATVSSSTNDSNTANNTSVVSTLIDADPNHFITVSPTCASPGESVQINGYNWPTNGTSDTTIYWEVVGGTVLGVVPDAVVEAGNGIWVRNVTIPASATNGLHTIVAHRPQGSGQQASTTITVPCPAPDIIISSNITMLTTPPILQGDPVSFRVTVTNTGVSPAVSQFPVSIYFNPNPTPSPSSTHISSTFKFASAGINGLGIGQSQVVTLTAQAGFPISGTNFVYAVADSDPAPDGLVDETNETNNISNSLSVNVLPCVSNCGGGGQTGNGILAGQAFVPSLSGELLPQPNVYVLLVGPQITQTQFTFTDNNGTYVFTGLATGTYTVSGCIAINGTSYFFAITVNIVSGLTTEQDLLLTQGPCT